jgi:RND family efflux transporter MFP subunit
VKPRYWIAAALAGLAVAAVVIVKSRPAAPAPGVRHAAPTVVEVARVDLIPVKEGPLARTVSVAGLLVPLRQTLLTAEVEGRIAEITVRPGDKVTQGQVLARMDPQDINSRIAESRANVAAARAQLDLAERTQQRNEELQAKNFISANSLDSSRSALASARENFRAREAQLSLVLQALPKATIRAPLRGVVSDRAIEVGQHVGANARLFSIVDLTELEFAAKLPVSEIGAIQIGQTVTLRVEGVSAPVEGRIERISPVAEDASRMIPVFIRVANRSEALKGGMVARGQIAVAGRDKTLSISDQALRDDQGKPWALVRVGDRLERRALELGIRDEDSGQVEVRAGLRAGEQVLLARIPAPELSRTLVVR